MVVGDAAEADIAGSDAVYRATSSASVIAARAGRIAARGSGIETFYGLRWRTTSGRATSRLWSVSSAQISSRRIARATANGKGFVQSI